MDPQDSPREAQKDLGGEDAVCYKKIAERVTKVGRASLWTRGWSTKCWVIREANDVDDMHIRVFIVLLFHLEIQKYLINFKCVSVFVDLQLVDSNQKI